MHHKNQQKEHTFLRNSLKIAFNSLSNRSANVKKDGVDLVTYDLPVGLSCRTNNMKGEDTKRYINKLSLPGVGSACGVQGSSCESKYMITSFFIA